MQYFTTQFYARHDTIVEEGDYGLEMCAACIHTCACAHACLRMRMPSNMRSCASAAIHGGSAPVL